MSNPVTIKFRRVGPVQVPAPMFLRSGDSGTDLHAAIEQDIFLSPGKRFLVPCGLQLEIPPGFEGQIRPRSGHAHDLGMTVLNSPGTIDSGYRGGVGVLLINHGRDPVIIRPLDRIAQLVIVELPTVSYELADELASSDRGEGGFGSTGV